MKTHAARFVILATIAGFFCSGLVLYFYEDSSAKAILERHIAEPRHHGVYTREEFAEWYAEHSDFVEADKAFQAEYGVGIFEALGTFIEFHQGQATQEGQ